jgi:hypothetical protein
MVMSLPGSNVSSPYKKLGAWLARSVATVYQADTDGTVVAITTAEDFVESIGLTDSATPPTVERTAGSYQKGGSISRKTGLSFPVKKNDYWEVTCTGVISAIFWIPLEP